MQAILSALLWFVKAVNGGKSGSGKYYYFLLPNNRSIQVSAQYSTACREVKMTGSKDNWTIRKYSQQKTFHIRKPKKQNKFLMYIAICQLRKNFWNLWRTFCLYVLDIYIKIGGKETVVERSACLIEFYIQLESTTT